MEYYTFVYLRRSSDEEDRQALSLPAQKRECLRYAQLHRIEPDEVVEESHSARYSGRPKFAAMVARAEELLKQQRRVRILCHKLDRLTRNYEDWSRVDELWGLGLDLQFVNGSVPNNAAGRLTLGLQVVTAKYHVDNLSEEVKKGLNEKLVLGEWPGWAPLGYRNVSSRRAKHRITIDQELAPLIRVAFERYATGEYSLSELSLYLFERGLAGRWRRRPIAKSVLRDRILSNPFYCGLMRYRGEVHQGSHKPIITYDLYTRVQQVMQGRILRKRRRHAFKYAGLFRCGRCGCAVVGDMKKGKYIYYRCSHRRVACDEPYIREELLEDKLCAKLTGLLLLTPGQITELRRAAELMACERRETDLARERIQKRIRELESRRDALLDLRLGGHICDEEFKAKRSQLTSDIAEFRDKLSAFEPSSITPQDATDRFIQTCNSVTDVIDQGTSTEVRQFLRILCSNYRLCGNEVHCEPLKPFDMASRDRNRSTWRAAADDIRNICIAASNLQQ